MYNTGNPVPSAALEDMADNAQTFDALVTKTEGTTTDRKGITRRVFQQILMDMGFQPLAGSFQTGATITARNQTLYDEVSKVFYAWGGVLPKVVTIGSTPATSGGVGVGAWSDKMDLMLRGDLASDYGFSLVTGVAYRFSNAIEMATSQGFTPKDGDVCITSGYYEQADGGGAEYAYSELSEANADGFLIHMCASGGRWILVDSRSRLPMQVAGAKVDGTTDDRTAFLAALAARRKMSLSGVMRVSGAAIDLSLYVVSQRLGLDIEGDDPNGAVIEFTSGSGGLAPSAFFRGMTLRNLTIRNGAMDKTGAGFVNPAGAEMLNWENVTFTGWRIGPAVHCWSSSLRNVTSRSCFYAGAYYGTSQKNGSFYAVQCDNGHQLGFAYSGGLSGTVALPASGLALAYSEFGALAAYECGTPYSFGRCFGIKLAGVGAERSTGENVINLSLFSVDTSRQNVTIECLDVYVQAEDGTTAVIGPVTNVYGALKIKQANIFSDKSIPLFASDGRGIKIDDVRYNSASTKPMTATTTNGLATNEELVIGSDYAQLVRPGFSQGGYDQVRKVKAFMALPVSATAKLVLRIQDTSVTGLTQGVFVSGKATFYPAHKGGNNAAREGGVAVFSVAADSAGSLASINLQKLGSLTGLTAKNRTTGTVQELALTLPAATVQYFCEVEFWCNGKFTSSFIDYYVEA